MNCPVTPHSRSLKSFEVFAEGGLSGRHGFDHEVGAVNTIDAVMEPRCCDECKPPMRKHLFIDHDGRKVGVDYDDLDADDQEEFKAQCGAQWSAK